jgi:TusA-related sulfurtransferase
MDEAAADIGEEPIVRLDLRGVACPMNFVKTRLKLDKMATGERLEVLLDSGEPIESVSSSVLSEGHLIESSTTLISPSSEGQMLSAEQPGLSPANNPQNQCSVVFRC